MPAEVVLDASALLVLLQGEPGAERVAACLPGARVSAVNLAEVVGKLASAGLSEAEARACTEGLGLRVEGFDAALAWTAGLLRPKTERRGLSLGDRACLALAASLGLPALTADRAWIGLGLGIEVELLRSRTGGPG